MNGLSRDDVMGLALEAGLAHGRGAIQIIKFANLVAATEREACAKVCEQRAADHEEDSRLEDDPDYKERFLVYAKHERRCAKEIRSRGNDAA